MRENRPYGSEGGEAQHLPDPYHCRHEKGAAGGPPLGLKQLESRNYITMTFAPTCTIE